MISDRRDVALIALTSLLFVVVLWATGLTEPWITGDTKGYLDVPSYPEFFSSHRLPFYGWFVAVLGGDRFGYVPVVWVQIVFHVTAAISLYASTRLIGIGRQAAWALFLAALCAQGFLIFGRGIHPEPLSTSFALIAMSATLAAIHDRGWRWAVVVAGLAGALSYLLRPTFLPLIVTLPLLYAMAARLLLRKPSAGRALALLVALAVPLVLYGGVRMVHTKDFNLVAFGGYAMSAMAGFMLSRPIVERFPPQDRELAAQMLAARERAEAEGRVARTPLNSRGERSFVSAAAGYFDIYARSYDDLVHGEIASLQRPNESWVEFDSRLRRLTVATVLLAPDRYAAWIVGGASRLVGRMTVTNAPFVLASFALLVLLLLTLRNPAGVRTLQGTPDTLLIVAIVAVYTLSTAPLFVLMMFPASRYIDTAAVLLPAVPLYAAFRLWPFRPSAAA
jgi:hypothetical protein